MTDETAEQPRETVRPKSKRPYVVVTGGSEGIGLALAERFAREGANLLLVARSVDALMSAASTLARLGAGNIDYLSTDLTQPDAPVAIETKLDTIGGYVDILVNNAGVGACGSFAEAEADDIDAIIHLNIRSATRLMRHFLPGMRARRSGGILNIASLGGYTPGPYQAAYYASKAYVISLSEAVASEVAADNVRVTVAAPGAVATGFHAKMGAETSWYRWLLPTATPRYVAWWAHRGFQLGLRVVVPGIFNNIAMCFLRLTPHRILVALIGALLNPKGWNNRNA